MSLFIQDKSTLYSDLLQSCDISKHSDYLFFRSNFLIKNFFFFFLCVGISITISKYQFVFTGEYVTSCVYVHTRMYIDIYCKYIVFIMLYTHTYI